MFICFDYTTPSTVVHKSLFATHSSDLLAHGGFMRAHKSNAFVVVVFVGGRKHFILDGCKMQVRATRTTFYR